MLHYPHNPTYFTEGFLWHQNHIYESTGHYGQSRLVEYDLKTGRLIKEVRLPKKYFGEGLALLNGKLYQLTYHAQTGLVYNAKTLKKIGEFHYRGEGWGLTTNGKQFIMSNGSDKLFFRNPKTFAIEKTVAVKLNGKPVNNLNELEYIHGKIYANVWHKPTIMIISPNTGKVIHRISIAPITPTGKVANGIAYDKDNKDLLVTGKYWPKIYAAKLNRVSR